MFPLIKGRSNSAMPNMMTQPADFDFWDKIPLLTMNEIGWLWCELEPPAQRRIMYRDDTTRPPNPPLSRVEIILHEITLSNKDASDPLKECKSHPLRVQAGGIMSFLRVDLRAWAERKGYQPLFLFPDLRTQARNSLNLDGALQIINALLSSETLIKWGKRKDGKPPTDRELTYGLAAKIEILCNLDRKDIGKYLKELVKLKNIG
jgi:hypothetical protein